MYSYETVLLVLGKNPVNCFTNENFQVLIIFLLGVLQGEKSKHCFLAVDALDFILVGNCYPYQLYEDNSGLKHFNLSLFWLGTARTLLDILVCKSTTGFDL